MPSPPSSGYRILPAVYDRWQNTYGRDFTAIILPRLLATIRHYHIPKSTLLDVGCGTGTLALAMARRGWDVTGVDASAGMIREAERKRRRTGLRMTFVQQDMRELDPARPVGLVTAMFDTLNHLSTPDELLTTFRAVHHALLPGGYFMFDLNNERCYLRLWTQEETVVHDDFTLVLDNRYDSATRHACSNVTLIPADGGEQQSETVRERFFTIAEVTKLLKKAGFTILSSEDFGFSDVPEAGKLKTWWVGRVEGSK